VHEHASSLSADELLVRATGRTLDAGAFEAHLRARYLD
jgi:Zn-dependent M32 family carboxypeptidase